MFKFAVPYHSQKKKSSDCGPVCVQMALDFFGIKEKLPNLVKDLNYTDMGTSAYDNAILLLKRGFKVSAVTAHPLLFSPDYISKIRNNEDLVGHLDKRSKQMNRFRKGIKLIKDFILQGGKMQLEIPGERHVQAALKRGSLILALLDARALGSKEGGFHFVVISGYKKGFVYINNPLRESARQAWFPVDRFFYGLHTSTDVDIDNGALLIVSK
jgi:hypothetical protein